MVEKKFYYEGGSYRDRVKYDNYLRESRGQKADWSGFKGRKNNNSFSKKAKKKSWGFVLVIVAIFVTGIANNYLGIYASMMGSVAFMDRFMGVTVSKDIYMNLGIVALTALIIIKLSRAGGREAVYRQARKKNKR